MLNFSIFLRIFEIALAVLAVCGAYLIALTLGEAVMEYCHKNELASQAMAISVSVGIIALYFMILAIGVIYMTHIKNIALREIPLGA